MKKGIISCALAIGLLLGVSSVTFARGGRGNGQGCQNSISSQPINYVETLKLSDDQVNKIKSLIQKDNTASKTLQDKIQTNFTLLREMEWSKNFDKAKADQWLKEMNASQASMQANHQKLNADIRSLLTSDQQNNFNAFGGCIGYGICGGGCTRGSGNTTVVSTPINYVEKLKLTDVQVNSVKALFQKDNVNMKALQDKIHTNFALLREMEWSKNFDKTKANNWLKEINDARTSMQTSHQKLNLDIRSLLTADQSKIFSDLGGCIGYGVCGGGTGCGRQGSGGCRR
jgi:Spy/CpxP family protein refolding chaperone